MGTQAGGGGIRGNGDGSGSDRVVALGANGPRFSAIKKTVVTRR